MEEQKEYPREPNEIDSSKPFWGAFQNNEKEELARKIVMFFQNINRWGPFTEEELRVFLKEKGDILYMETLLEYYWLIKKEEVYFATNWFINDCYRSSPKK